MLTQGQVGPLAVSTSLTPGLQTALRQGNLGDLIQSELHGRYYETNYRRALFSAANQAVTATTAGVATTYTGICLSNPIGSQVNLVINKVGVSFVVAQTSALAYGIMAGYNSGTNVTHTTALTPSSNFIGVGSSGTGLVDAACTLPTAPVVKNILGVVDTGATTVATEVGGLFDLEGAIILPPGAYAAIWTSAASVASSFWGSLCWEEVPV